MDIGESVGSLSLAVSVWQSQSSATEEGQDEREQDTQDDRGRQREIKTEVPAPYVDVAGEPSQRHTEHDQHAQRRDAEADQHERLTHNHRLTNTKDTKDTKENHSFSLRPLCPLC